MNDPKPLLITPMEAALIVRCLDEKKAKAKDKATKEAIERLAVKIISEFS